MKKIKGVVGLLGSGEIGSAIGRICKESGFKVLVRELKYDELKGENIDYFHISIPEKDNNKFIEIAVKNIKEFKPELTIINILNCNFNKFIIIFFWNTYVKI